MSEADFNINREEFQELHDKFRDLKHNINNSLAVMMALSELAQRNPAHFEKLGKAVLQRGPEIVQGLHEFQMALLTRLKPNAATHSASYGIFEPLDTHAPGTISL